MALTSRYHCISSGGQLLITPCLGVWVKKLRTYMYALQRQFLSGHPSSYRPGYGIGPRPQGRHE